MRPLFTAMILALPCLLFAQFQVKGTLNDANAQPLGFANVLLLSNLDSSFVAGATSSDDGSFTLQTDQAGNFIVRASMLGFEEYNSEVFSLNTNQNQQMLPTIILQEGGIALESIEVTAEKPVFERQIDRTVVNVANTITAAGFTALEVLERSPGVIVNRASRSISMLGKEGVNVMINGKLNYMPADALVDYLAGLSADNILKIELITTPPAEFDAQGNAGYINIVLKQNPEEGLNGNYALAAGYGRGLLANGSVNINYRKNKVHLFGGYAYTHNARESFTDLFRIVGNGANEIETYLASERAPVVNNQNARLGLDYQLTEKMTVGVLFSGYINLWDMDARSVTEIRPAEALDTLIVAPNVEENYWRHLQNNLNLKYRFDNGSSLNADVDYLIYNNENPTTYEQTFSLEDDTPLFQEALLSDKTTDFTILVGKLDYAVPLNENVRLSTGIKSVQSDFENKVSVQRDGMLLDEFGDISELEENVFATYVQADYQLSPQTLLKAGLRYEYTDTEVLSFFDGKVVDRAFGSLFPSAFLQHQFNDENQLNLSYSRRINRPAFSDMASFVIFLDPNTIYGGNATLQPAIANAFQLDYRYKTINFSIQYTIEDSTIVRYQNRFDASQNLQTIVPVNLSNQQTFTASATFPIRVSDWWNMRFYAQYTYQEATSEDQGEFYTFDQNTFFINGSQSFTLPNDFELELSGFFRSPTLDGNVNFEPVGILNFGIQKRLKNNASLSFNIGDVLNSLELISSTNLPQQNFFVERLFDFSQRTFNLSYSMSFGNQKMNNSRNRQTEELNRVN